MHKPTQTYQLWHYTIAHEAVVDTVAGLGFLVLPSPDETSQWDSLGLDDFGLTRRESDLLDMLDRLTDAGFEPLVHSVTDEGETWATIATLDDGRPVAVLKASRPVVVGGDVVRTARDEMLRDLGLVA